MDASNRQERLRMRQRGAGTRKIDAVDFGISFDPTPRRSARNTPQPTSQRRQSRTPLTARGALRRPSKTPSKASAQSSSSNDLRQGSDEPSVLSRSGVYDGPLEESEIRSWKRRKLSSPEESAQLITPATTQASAPSLSGGRSTSARKTSSLPIQIAEVAEQTQPESNGKITAHRTDCSPEADKENFLPGSQATKTPRVATSKRTPRTTKSAVRRVQRPSSRSSSRPSDNISIMSATGDVDSEDEVLVAVLNESEDESLDDPPEGVSLLTAQGEFPDSTMELVVVLEETTMDGNGTDHRNVIDPSLLTEDQLQTPGPRSANIKKKRSSLRTPGQQSAERRVSYDISQPSSESSAQLTQPEFITPHQTQPALDAHPPSDDSFYQANQDEEDGTYLLPSSPVIPTPKTVVKKPRTKKPTRKSKRTSTSASSSSSTHPKRKRSNSTTFPILTHRLTNTSALPTITEEPEPEPEPENSDSDTDPSSNQTFTKFHNRPHPNAVDVLAQFCREDIEAAIENIGTTTTTTTNNPSTLKRKRLALLAFSTELEAGLFDLSTAVEHRLSLEARAKRSTRDKTKMQTKWMEVRQERERVARRTEELRARKAEKEREEEGVRALSERLWRVEMEVQRAETGNGEEEGLEWKLRTVGEGVSGRVGGGLLERVREFNGVLEGLLGVLDRRRT